MKPRTRSAGLRPGALLLFLMAVLAVGCRTVKTLPPSDFSSPGWRVQQGQAVWKPSKNRPELGGDMLLATNVNGNFFIQFSKIPFPLATAQVSGDQWLIKFGADQYVRHGSGTPPNRFGWFQLPQALRGANLGGDWRLTRVEPNSWRLENPCTGETLEGKFFP